MASQGPGTWFYSSAEIERGPVTATTLRSKIERGGVRLDGPVPSTPMSAPAPASNFWSRGGEMRTLIVALGTIGMLLVSACQGAGQAGATPTPDAAARATLAAQQAPAQRTASPQATDAASPQAAASPVAGPATAVSTPTTAPSPTPPPTPSPSPPPPSPSPPLPTGPRAGATYEGTLSTGDTFGFVVSPNSQEIDGYWVGFENSRCVIGGMLNFTFGLTPKSNAPMQQQPASLRIPIQENAFDRSEVLRGGPSRFTGQFTSADEAHGTFESPLYAPESSLLKETAKSDPTCLGTLTWTAKVKAAP